MSNIEGRNARGLAENFELIEAAVMESPRGRWFLAEYAARLRARETTALSDQVKSLETTVTANHDAIMSRIAQALGQPAIPPSSSPQPDLAPRHMKFFKRDEEIFEAAPQAAITAVKPVAPPEEKRGAKLTIRRSGEPPPVESAPAAELASAESAPEASAEKPESPAATQPPTAPPAAAPLSAEDAQRRRIVIIRHKPGETVDVPLQEEMAQAS